MLDIVPVTSKTIETNKYVHCFAIKTIEFYAVRVIISDIAVEFYVKFRLNKKFQL